MAKLNMKLLRGRQAGQGLVELAIALPILLLLVLGVVEFARAWNLHQVITDAARETARVAVVADASITDTAQVSTVAQQAISRAGFNPANATILITGFRGGTGTPATVSIEYPHRLRIIQGLLGWATTDATFHLRTSTTMRNE
jgi:Flp pilus assembly protein TadG